MYAVNGMTYPDIDFDEPIESRHTHIFSFRELDALLRSAGFTVTHHFFADVWNNANKLKALDWHLPLNKALRDLLASYDEFQNECIFIAACPSLELPRLS